MAKWKKSGQSTYFHYLDNIQSIYIQKWIQKHLFWGGHGAILPNFQCDESRFEA